MATKFGTKWAITRHMYEISPRFLHLTRDFKDGQINNFSKSIMVDSRSHGKEMVKFLPKIG